MNIIRLQEVLGNRNIIPFTGLRNKYTVWSFPGPECIRCNRPSSSTVGQTMHKSLKLKLQNAINLNSSAEADCPAVFVGGRRRNRKKRKSKNGPSKRRGKKALAHEPVVPTNTIYATIEDAIEPVYTLKTPIVSCLDIQEPVFSYKPMTSHSRVAKERADSQYDSNESLESCSSRRDSGCENDESGEEISSDTDTPDKVSSQKFGLPARSHSNDSGVFDEESADDAGYDEEIDDDVSGPVISDFQEVEQSGIDTQRDSVSVHDHLLAEVAVGTLADTEELSDEVNDGRPDKFEEIDLHDDENDVTHDVQPDVIDEVIEDASEEAGELRIIRQLSRFSDADNLLKLGSDENDEEDIIFDLSQLELNTTQEEISNLKQAKIRFQLEDDSSPTLLGEEPLSRVSMDLLIDDDEKNDEVLFDARDRKQVSITCNPLYEHVLKEEDDKFSIKSFQSGFTTNFDNINYIQLPGAATSKTHQRETTPLLSRRKDGEKDEELACCIIL